MSLFVFAVVDNFFKMNNLPMYKLIPLMFDIGVLFTNSTLNDQAFQHLLQQNEKFDVIVVELFFTDALLALGHHYDAPVVGISTFGTSKMTSGMVAAPEIASYIPNVFTGFSDRMAFSERLVNWIRNSLEDISNPFLFLPRQESLLQYFPKKNIPSITQLQRNVSLILVNNHVTFGFPRPYPPNMIEVGGLHIDRTTQPLPEKLKRFLDGAKEGVIYFSMGSNIKFSQMQDEKRNEILNSFKSFPRKRLIFKSDVNFTIPSHSSNDVIVENWFPQQAILAHPNVHLFITHGGLLSTMESVYFGKPVVGVPVLGDQHLNMNFASSKGYGEAVPYENLNANLFNAALDKVLLNPRFAQ